MLNVIKKQLKIHYKIEKKEVLELNKGFLFSPKNSSKKKLPKLTASILILIYSSVF